MKEMDPTKPRDKSPTILNRFDNFLADWRRGRSRSEKGDQCPPKSCVLGEASPTDREGEAAVPAAEEHRGLLPSEERLQQPEQGSSHTAIIALQSTSPEDAASNSQAPKHEVTLSPSSPPQDSQDKSPTPSQAVRSLSFAESLEQFAKRHEHIFFSSPNKSIAASHSAAIESLSPPEGRVVSSETEETVSARRRRLCAELEQWRADHPYRVSLVALASTAHQFLSSGPTVLSSEGLQLLNDVRWPALHVVGSLILFPSPVVATACHRAKPDEDMSEAEMPGSPSKQPQDVLHAAVLFTSSAVPVTEALVGDSADCTAVAPTSSASHHLTLRLLDFFNAYDPQRIPGPDRIRLVLECHIPECILFGFLQARYGLSAAWGSAPSTSAKAAEASFVEAETQLATTSDATACDNALSVGVTPLHQGGRHRQRSTSTTAPWSPSTVCDVDGSMAASPDFGMHSPNEHSSPQHRDEAAASYAADTSSWPAEWVDAVLPLVPAAAEILSETWNSLTSKPGLSNPRTQFPTSTAATQLFTFFGAFHELTHADASVAELPQAGLGACKNSSFHVTDVGGIVTLPWPQSVALNNRYSTHCNKSEKLEGLDAEQPMRNSVTLLEDFLHAAASSTGQRRQRHPHDAVHPSLSDTMAMAMLDGTLNWQHDGRPAASGARVVRHSVEFESAPLLLVEDPWGADVVDMRPVQSPIEVS